MSKIFYISDLHLCHEKIIEKAERPFGSVEEMNETIIKRWNARVSTEDMVYILGDLGLYHQKEIAFIMMLLKGKKILIRGNHDIPNLRDRRLREPFVKIADYMEVNDNGRIVCLSHYPIEEWNGFNEGYYHIHGHMHNCPLRNIQRRYSACVEMTDYEPVTLNELIAMNYERGDEE